MVAEGSQCTYVQALSEMDSEPGPSSSSLEDRMDRPKDQRTGLGH